MSGFLTTTGSWLLVSSRWSQYPWKPSQRPPAPAVLQMGGRRQKGLSDKGIEWRIKRRERAAAEWNRQAAAPLVFSTSQSKATVCEKSIFQSHSAHLQTQGKKRNICRANISKTTSLSKEASALDTRVAQRWVEAKTAAESRLLGKKKNK